MPIQRILVVDDSPVERHLLTELLISQGYKVTIATDGAQGIETAKRDQPDLVLGHESQLARVPGLVGATVLPDGSVALIVDPLALTRRGVTPAHASHAVPPSPTFGAAPGTPQAAVLVVDDSLTVRKITGRLLERAGYRVMTAKDGEDALAHRAQAPPAGAGTRRAPLPRQALRRGRTARPDRRTDQTFLIAPKRASVRSRATA